MKVDKKTKQALQFLIDDEYEAIEGYDRIQQQLSETMSKSDFAKIKTAFDEIRGDEEDHIRILTNLQDGIVVTDEDKPTAENLKSYLDSMKRVNI